MQGRGGQMAFAPPRFPGLGIVTEASLNRKNQTANIAFMLGAASFTVSKVSNALSMHLVTLRPIHVMRNVYTKSPNV